MKRFRQILLIFRFHFSFLLSPVFFYGLIFIEHILSLETISLFLILHLLVYPSSNAYNSYIDQDEGSIGGLKNPPKADKNIYLLSVLFDLMAIVLSYFYIPFTFIPILLYIIFSRAYSSKELRLKKYPIISFLVVTIFQGPVIFLSVLLIDYPLIDIPNKSQLINGLLSSFFLIGGNYPITQIYQHVEDIKRGDITLSIKLGIKGSLIFANLFFIIGFVFLLLSIPFYSITLIIILFPAIYLSLWTKNVFKNEELANFKNTMYCVLISAISLNLIFIIMNILK